MFKTTCFCNFFVIGILFLILLCNCASLKKQRGVNNIQTEDNYSKTENNYSISRKIVKNLFISPLTFNPSSNDSVVISYYLNLNGRVSIDIVDEDGFVIKKLIENQLRKKEIVHAETWYGKDNQENVVPNEAYFPIVSFYSEADTEIVNPILNFKAKEVISKDIQYNSSEKIISYSLNAPSRMLLRIGIKNGALFNTLVMIT